MNINKSTGPPKYIHSIGKLFAMLITIAFIILPIDINLSKEIAICPNLLIVSIFQLLLAIYTPLAVQAKGLLKETFSLGLTAFLSCLGVKCLIKSICPEFAFNHTHAYNIIIILTVTASGLYWALIGILTTSKKENSHV